MDVKVIINGSHLQVKEWDGQRVVTLADVDRVHERPEGTAKRNFAANRKHLIEGEDYFHIYGDELQILKQSTDFVPSRTRSIILLTESGYLLLVKSFSDDLAWKVQRELVNTYFKATNLVKSVQLQDSRLILPEQKFDEAIDQLTTCAAIFQNMIAFATINYHQQQELLQLVRNRVNFLLGGIDSDLYKKRSRAYFKNLWMDFGRCFHCGTYKDLNPLYFDAAQEWIQNWNYT